MDTLKRGISLRGYANENPINAYKREGLEMFNAMVESIQEDTVRLLLKAEIRNAPAARPARPQNLQANDNAAQKSANSAPVAKKKVGRNDPCPCGSGLKYKNCCGKK